MITKCYDWMCQCYNKLTWRDTATKVLITLTILLYPFNRFPYGPFQKLTLFPILGILFLNLDRFLVLWWRNKYLRFVAFTGVLWLIWIGIATCLALGVEGLNGLGLIGIEIKRFVPWYVFVMGCLLFDFEEIKRYIYWGFVGLLGYTSLYAVIELLYFVDVEWAKNFLGKSIYYFMEMRTDRLWWPVFWTQIGEERCRSVFEEPAYYANLLVFCALFFSYFAWVAKKWKGFIGNILLSSIAIFFLYTTLSAAGAISFTLAASTWVLVALCFAWKQNWKTNLRMGILLVLFVVSSILTLTNQRHSSQSIMEVVKTATTKENEKTNSQNNAQKSVDQKVVPAKVEKKATPAKKKRKVRTARSIHLAAELKLIAASPIYGYGADEYGNVMREALREENKVDRQWQVKRWVNSKEPPHAINSFTLQAVRVGIPGLVLFISWLLLPIAFIWFKNLKKLSLQELCIAVALGLFPVCMMLSAFAGLYSYFFLLSFPILFIIKTPTYTRTRDDGRSSL